MKRLLLALGFVALTGSAFAQNWSKELESAAKGGDVEAQVQVGHAYLKGEGVKKNTKKATQYLSKATLQGSEEAKDLLYSFYNTELIKKAWAEGDAEAQYRLGLCLLEGAEVAQNTELAAAWMEKSMEQGYEEARAKFYSFDSEVRRRRVKTLEGYCNGTQYTYIGEVIEKDEKYYLANGECVIRSEYGEEISGIWENGTLKNATFKRKGLELHGDISSNCCDTYKTPAPAPAPAPARSTSESRTSVANSDADLILGSVERTYTPTPAELWEVAKELLTEPILAKGGEIVIRDYDILDVGGKLRYGIVDSIVVENTPHRWKAEKYEYGKRSGHSSWMDEKGYPIEDDVTLETEVVLYAEAFQLPSYRDMSYGVKDIISKVNDGRDVNAKLRFTMGGKEGWGSVVFPMGIQWIGCDITCQNGARVVKNMSGVAFAVYPADGSEPIVPEKGTVITENGLSVSWKHHKDCTDGRPWQIVLKKKNGEVIDVRVKELPYNGLGNEREILSLINGYYYWVFAFDYDWRQVPYGKGESIVLDWRSKGDAQGTYTHADGSVEKIIDGFTETEIREEAERVKREEEERRKAYEEKCRKYGKTYVDAAAEYKIIVGMPLELAKEVYSYSNTLGLAQLDLWAEYSNGRAIYHILSIVNGVEASVYVEDNKITDITWYIERKKK